MVERATVEFQERELPHPGRCYDFSIGGERLGFVYVGSDMFSIAWPGRIDFTRLPDLASEALTFDRKGAVTETVVDRMKVKLVYENELVELDLAQAENVEEYAKRLVDPSTILFARYDIVNPDFNGDIGAAFTAANTKKADEEELSILLPRSIVPPEALADWIFRHHSDQALSERVDRALFASRLAEIIRN